MVRDEAMTQDTIDAIAKNRRLNLLMAKARRSGISGTEQEELAELLEDHYEAIERKRLTR